MIAYFYTKLITIEPLLEEMDSLELSDQEREHLSDLIDSSLYHVILDQILLNLSEEDKRTFLEKFSDNPNDDQLLEFLNQKVENIEDKIKKASDELITKMHQDVKQSKRLKP